MDNRKGISLSITAIVVIAVGLVVLLVLLGFFVGGFGRSGEAMRDVTVTAEDQGGAEVQTGMGKISDIWKGGEGDDCKENEDCASAYFCNASDMCQEGSRI